MKKLLVALLAILMVITFTACSGNGGKKQPEEEYNKEFNELLMNWFVEDMSEDYLSLHFGVNDPEAYGIEVPDPTLGEVETPDDYTGYTDRLAVLETIDTATLSSEQKMTYDTLVDYYTVNQELYELEVDYGFIFTPNSGLNNNLVTNYTEFAIRSEQDAKDLIALVIDAGRYIDECIEYTKNQAEEGIIQRDDVIDGVIDSCERFISNVEDNEVIKAFELNIADLNLSNEEELKSQLKDAVINTLIPAYQRIIDFYKTLKGKATNQLGIANYENGKEYYAALFKYKSSSSKSVEEYEKLLEKAINNIVYEIVYTELNSAESKAANFPDYGYTDPYEMVEYVKSKMGEDFPSIPNVSYSIDYLDPSVASDSIVAYYLIAAVDDLKTNIIKCNQSYCADDPAYLAITLCHEGYPGHLYQHTYYFSNHASQVLRYNISYIGYTEGWAMYVENYGYEFYENFSKVVAYNIAYNKFNYYLMAYIDILVNYEGYDVDDVANYLANYFNEIYAKKYAEDFVSAVIGDPGMYLPYAIGYYNMCALQQKASEALGDKFDEKEYNQLVLDCGETSFELLEAKIDEYIASKK